MDLYQLRYFLEVARERSFTRAARNLHVSPPAVSKSVALLERSLKRKLLTRTKRRVEVTADGERMLARVEQVHDILEGLRLEFEGLSAGDPASLRVGSREMITNYLLGPSLLAFRRKHPATRFGLYELSPRQMADALRKDLIDFAFYYSDLPDPALEVRKLGFLPSHVYASPELWKGARAPRGFSETCRLPFVAPRYFQADPTEPSPDGFPDRDHPRNILYEAELLETHRRFALDGVAAAVLPDFVMSEDRKAGRVVRCPGPPLGREIYFIKRKTRPLPKAVPEFLDVLERTIRRLS